MVASLTPWERRDGMPSMTAGSFFTNYILCKNYFFLNRVRTIEAAQLNKFYFLF